MAASSFCTADFNWRVDKPPVNVIKYSFIDLNLDSENDVPFQGRADDNSACPIELLKRCEDSECCVRISCSNPGSAQINGISIISQSRTLEISNNTEGYIATARGKKIPTCEDNLVNESQSQTVFYRCSHVFSTPQIDFQIKFMSLGNQDRFLVRSVAINMHQGLEAGPRMASGTFDMAKLKSDVEGMGDTVSQKALDFLKTMELYEQNKFKTMGNWLGSVGQEVPSSTSPDCSPSQPIPGVTSVPGLGQGQGLSAIMESVLGQGVLQSLSKTQARNGSPNGNGSNIFSMLQAVCGEVSKTRKPMSGPEDSAEDSSSNGDGMDASPNSSAGENGRNNKLHGSILPPDVMVLVESRLNEAKAEMKSEIEMAKKEVLTKLDEVRQDLDGKMSLILELLRNNSITTCADANTKDDLSEKSAESPSDDMDR